MDDHGLYLFGPRTLSHDFVSGEDRDDSAYNARPTPLEIIKNSSGFLNQILSMFNLKGISLVSQIFYLIKNYNEKLPVF